MTHTFTKTPREHSSIDEATVMVSTDAEHLANVVAAFEDYLRGCGFHFDGHLDFVDTGGGQVEHIHGKQDVFKYRPDSKSFPRE